VLLLAGQRTRPRVPGRVYQQMEIEYGAFHRQVRLTEDVDPERATASFEHGVLTIVLPVAAQAPRRGRFAIEVVRA
jgi:HSP20 family protein